MGAMGIVVPFVNTPEEAELGARACRYPPAGTRGEKTLLPYVANNG